MNVLKMKLYSKSKRNSAFMPENNLTITTVLTTSPVSLFSALTCKMSIPQLLLTETGVHTTHPQQEGTVAG